MPLYIFPKTLFIILCFFIVFAALVEFACLNFLDTLVRRLKRREMERKGHRFMSDCDSELLAVYTANNLANGASLSESLSNSINEIDGVFTYLVATQDQLGMAKDTMAAKPLVLYESDDFIAMASEEVAIRAILPQEIETYDPYDEEVRVWKA